MLKIKKGTGTLVKIGHRGDRFTGSPKQRGDSNYNTLENLEKEETLALVLWQDWT